MRGAASLLAAAALVAAASSDFYISVVEPSPERAVVLAAAVDAAVGAAGDAAVGATGDTAVGATAAIIAPVEPYEPLALPRQLCEQAAGGAVAAVGGAAGAAAAARAGLPLLLVDPAPAPLNASAEAVALYPHQDDVAKAIADLAHQKGWQSAVLLHEGAAAPAALLAADDRRLRLAARQLPPPEDASLLRYTAPSVDRPAALLAADDRRLRLAARQLPPPEDASLLRYTAPSVDRPAALLAADDRRLRLAARQLPPPEDASLLRYTAPSVDRPASLLAADDRRLRLAARQLPPPEDASLLRYTAPSLDRPAALLAADDRRLRLAARQMPPPEDASLLRNLLLVLKKAGHVNFIVWAGAARAAGVLAAAQRAGLLADRHAYLLPALDLHTQDLRHLSYGGANITGLMLFDPDSEAVQRTMLAWHAAYRARLGESFNASAARALRRAPPAALLLAHDAAALVAAAHAHLALRAVGAPPDCRSGRGAFHADTIINYIRSEDWKQASGAIQWRWDGARLAARLVPAELLRGGRLAPAGSWGRGAGVEWARPPLPAPARPPDSMANATFTVLIAENKPYVMKTESIFRLSGNKRYEGFCIELIEKLAELLHFNYTFEEQLDKDYNKMLDRLTTEQHIDFAVTDLTITSEREKLVDFTTPFMNLGISILFLKPKPPEPDLWAFLLPFSSGVWLWLGVAYVGTSAVLYAVGRLCPDEWQNPYPCVEEPPALENQFTLGNALWFNLGAVLLQGSEIAPVAYGTRAVASAWWLFALVITSSYTANLATLLSKKTPTEVIHNVRELADNELGITYGAKKKGSTYDFFRNSQNESELFRKMFEHMRQWDMPNSNEEGIQRVMDGDFAFLMESTTIEYTVERNCAVKEVGEHLDSRVYGIAMKKNSPYRQALNMALLNLQERGVLRQMKHVWWKEKHGGGACKDSDGGGGGEDEGLSMANFRGLWLVLAVGCALGVAVGAADLAWVAARRPRDPHQTFARNFWSELKFVFRFQRSVKPLQGTLSPTPSPSPTPPSSPQSARDGSGSGSPAGAEEAGREEEAGRGGRSPSPAWSGRRMRRRSSMYTASLRLAAHTKHAR